MDEWEISKREEMASDATMRDYFAAKAMQGMIASRVGPNYLGDIASRSYAIADAMLRARGQ